MQEEKKNLLKKTIDIINQKKDKKFSIFCIKLRKLILLNATYSGYLKILIISLPKIPIIKDIIINIIILDII